MFDTHQFVKDMTGAKMPKAQAEMLGKALLDSRTNTATKGDIAGATELMDAKFASVDVRFEHAQKYTDQKVASVANELFVKYIIALIAFVAVLVALASLIFAILQYLNQ